MDLEKDIPPSETVKVIPSTETVQDIPPMETVKVIPPTETVQDIPPTETMKPTLPKVKRSKRKRPKKTRHLSKNSLGVLRTTLRNNIELTNIADNKANVLLSLNALMLTFMMPLLLPYFERVTALRLGFPLIVLVLTNLTTIYLAVHVLKPGKLVGQAFNMNGKNDNISPFFFGNFQNMTKDQFLKYSSDVLSNEFLVKSFISNDFYHIGLRLAEKMKLVRKAFNIFIYGMTTAIILTIIVLVIYA